MFRWFIKATTPRGNSNDRHYLEKYSSVDESSDRMIVELIMNEIENEIAQFENNRVNFNFLKLLNY